MRLNYYFYSPFYYIVQRYMVVRTLLLGLVLSFSCTTTPLKPVPKQCEDSCQAVLDARDDTMKKFRTLCMGLAYVAARHYDDENIRQEVNEGMRVCSYVYGSR